MSVQRLICCVALLVAITFVEAAPQGNKESANENESESISHEAESKEMSEESIEPDSEYQDKDSKPDPESSISRGDLLRPSRIPETYGLPGSGNPDFIPLAQILAESVKFYQEYNNKN